MRSFAILFGAAAIACAAPALAADDIPSTAAAVTTLSPGDWAWSGDAAADGPLHIVISLADQRAYVFRGGTLIAAASASTGRDGKETPTGTFPILQKQVTHHSSLYNDAPMPYMERLTWGGVAIHAGVTPGYPTSHGCIHVPMAFAKMLYGATDIGTVVDVVDGPVYADLATLIATATAGNTGAEAAHANAAVLAEMQ